MSRIGPGDWVECIRSDGERDVRVHIGCLYQVARLGRPPGDRRGWHCGMCGEDTEGDRLLDLVGLKLSDNWRWCVCCFKPADRRPADALIASLKTPIPVKQMEPA